MTALNKSQGHINLNFHVVPTAQGPMIVQKGVTVQPTALDNIFAQLKYQNIPRPVSARNRHDSFVSNQSSWDGAAHFKSSAIRIGQNHGDNPGLGRHYNPTRHRHRRAEQSVDPDPDPCSSSYSQKSHDDAGSTGDGRRVIVNTTNVDSRGHPREQTFMKIDAQSQTSEPPSPGTGSISPERVRKPTKEVHQYTMPQRSRVGQGQGVFSDNMVSPLIQAKQPQSEWTGSNLNSEDRRFMNAQDRHAAAFCDIGLNREDRDLSSIEPGVDDRSVARSQNLVEEFEKDEGIGPNDKMGSSRVLLKPTQMLQPGARDPYLATETSGKQKVNDLVAFKQVLAQQRKPSWTEEEFHQSPGRQQPDAMSFAQRSTNPPAGDKATPLGHTPGFHSHISGTVMSGHDEEKKMAVGAGGGVGPQRFQKDQYRLSKDDVGTPNLASFRVSRGPESTPDKNPTNAMSTLHNRVFQGEPQNNGLASNNFEPIAQEATSNQSMQKSSKNQSYSDNMMQQQQLFSQGIQNQGQAPRGGQPSDNIYNLDNDVELFSDRAGQTQHSIVANPTKYDQASTTETQNMLTRKIIQAFEEGQGTLQGTRPSYNVFQGEVDDGDQVLRQTSLASQLVWQPSMEPDSQNDNLKVVSEENSNQGMSKNSSPTLEMPPMIGVKMLSERNSSTKNNSTRGSTKRAATTKKKKKGSASKILVTSIRPIPKASLTLNRASPSLSLMKVESVKSSMTALSKASGSLSAKAANAAKLTGCHQMVLKSNVAMASQLPKNMAKSSVKKPPMALNKSGTRKQTMSKSAVAKKEDQMVVAAKNSSQLCTDELRTPNNILTPPNLEFPSTSGKQDDLFASFPNSKTNKEAKAQGSPQQRKSTEGLRVEISKSIIIPSRSDDQASDCKSITMQAGPTSNGELSPCAPMSLAQNTLNTLDANTMEDVMRSETKHQTGRRKKEDRAKSSRNENLSSAKKSSSPCKSTRELQVLEIPKEYDQESDHVVEYMFGDKAIEIEAPLYQVNIEHKLVYSLTQLNGEEPPAFIRLVESKLGRKVIKIRQKETTGVQQLFQLKLEVRNPDTNVSGVYKCRVFVKPGTKLLLRKSLFNSPVEYSIRGPAKILQMPVYSAKHDDLDFYLEPMNYGYELPSFIKISRDEDGNRCLKCIGSDTCEVGSYDLKLIARDKITRVINEEFMFQVVGTPGIEVKHLPKEYEEEIKVDPTKSCIQLAMPTFNLETVKEEQAMPLEYSLVMPDGEPVPDFIFIKTSEDGDHLIELRAADLPPGLNSIFEVYLKVYDPNSDAKQLIPISVKCPEPNLMLILKDTNFPDVIDYNLGSKEILVRVPQYQRNDNELVQEPIMLTLGGKESISVNRISTIHTNEKGEQFIKVQTSDQKLKGSYDIRVYATEQNSGLTCQDAVFQLNVLDSILTLTETPNVCYLGKALLYKPKGPPTYIPLPQYAVNRAQIKFSLACDDPKSQVPQFVRIQGDYLIVEGTQNPSAKDFNLKLKVYDPVSETNEELSLTVTTDIYEIILEKMPIASPVEFYLGDEIALPLPEFKQVPFKGELTYELEIQGVGMMLAGIELASIVKDEDGKYQIKIAGGENSNKGTYQVTIVASEPSLGVSNKQANFMLEAKPQLKLVSRPAEFDSMPILQVDQVYKIPVPTYSSNNRLRYQIQEKGNDDEQSCPSFIAVKCPRQAQPYIEVKCSEHDPPTKNAYQFELISCDNKQHNVEDTQQFSLQFNLQPKVELVSFEVENPVKYRLRQGALMIPMPTYSCYNVQMKNLDVKLIHDFNERPIPFATVDRESNQIMIKADNDGFEGLHDVTVVVSIPEFEQSPISPKRTRGMSASKVIRNIEAKFRVDVSCPSTTTLNNQPSSDTLALADRDLPSSDTLALADAQSEERKDGYRVAVVEIGDKISKIEETEEIPIYYSDHTDDQIGIAASSNPRNNIFEDNQQEYSDDGRSSSPSVTRQDDLVRLPRSSTEAGDIVVTRDRRRDKHSRSHRRGDPRRDTNLDNQMIADNIAASIPQEQIDMLMKENEEIRRQIAEVKNQLNASTAFAAGTSYPGHTSPHSDFNLQDNNNNIAVAGAPAQATGVFENQYHQEQQTPPATAGQNQDAAAMQALYASMQMLNGQAANNLSGLAFTQQNLVSNLHEIQFQEEQIINSQLRQKIEQSKLRSMHQMGDLDRIRSEVNQGTTQQQQQLLNRYLNETHRDGQGREKDIRLRQLRTQLAQLQESRADLRRQCTGLKKREDDLSSDIHMRDLQEKQFQQMNDEESTKASQIFTEIDRVKYRNDVLHQDVETLEEQLEQKKQIVNQNKAKLKDLESTQGELEEHVRSSRFRLSKLRNDVDTVKRRMDHEEHQQSMMLQQTPAPTLLNPQSMPSQHERLQTATFSPQNVQDSKYMGFERNGQQQMRNSLSNGLSLQKLEYDRVKGMSEGRNSVRVDQQFQQQLQYNNYQDGNQQQQQMIGGQPGGVNFALNQQSYIPQQMNNVHDFLYQPQDSEEMPAAGMPSARKRSEVFTSTPIHRQVNNMSSQSVGANGTFNHPSQQQQPVMSSTQQFHPGQFSRSGANIPTFSPSSRGGGGGMYEYRQQNSSEKKITNPRPPQSCRPLENNIFGEKSPEVDRSDRERFQTTYTQFTNREKFRGLKGGEQGGLRINNIPPDGICRLEQLKRQSSNLYPTGVRQGQASGMTTVMRRSKEQRSQGALPANGNSNANYENRYRH